MLKWLVTGREGGESPRVTKMRTDDGDDGGNNGNKYSMFHVNRSVVDGDDATNALLHCQIQADPPG